MSNSLALTRTTEQLPSRLGTFESEPLWVHSDILAVPLSVHRVHQLPVQLRIHSPSPWQMMDDEDMEVTSHTWRIDAYGSVACLYRWNLFHGDALSGDMRKSMTEVIVRVSPWGSWHSSPRLHCDWDPPYGIDPFSVSVVENRLSKGTDGVPYYGHIATATIRRRLLWGSFSDDELELLRRTRNQERPRMPTYVLSPTRMAYSMDAIYGAVVVDLLPVEFGHRRAWNKKVALPHAVIRKGFSDSSLLSDKPPEFTWTAPVRTQDMEFKPRY